MKVHIILTCTLLLSHINIFFYYMHDNNKILNKINKTLYIKILFLCMDGMFRLITRSDTYKYDTINGQPRQKLHNTYVRNVSNFIRAL